MFKRFIRRFILGYKKPREQRNKDGIRYSKCQYENEDCSKRFMPLVGMCDFHYSRVKQRYSGPIGEPKGTRSGGNRFEKKTRGPYKTASKTKKCKLKGCNKPYYSKNYCEEHYSKNRRPYLKKLKEKKNGK